MNKESLIYWSLSAVILRRTACFAKKPADFHGEHFEKSGNGVAPPPLFRGVVNFINKHR